MNKKNDAEYPLFLSLSAYVRTKRTLSEMSAFVCTKPPVNKECNGSKQEVAGLQDLVSVVMEGEPDLTCTRNGFWFNHSMAWCPDPTKHQPCIFRGTNNSRPVASSGANQNQHIAHQLLAFLTSQHSYTTSPSCAPSRVSAVSWKCSRRCKRVYIFFQDRSATNACGKKYSFLKQKRTY